MKPFAESCEQNKQPILEVLREEFANSKHVLEVGSGTGQHAVYFATELPHLHWTCSDLPDNHAGIRLWLEEAALDNISGPLALDAREPWPDSLQADAVFSANAIHIMSWQAVQGMIENIGKLLASGGKLCLYGPFMIDGKHTSESNIQFDAWLKQRDPVSGVRNLNDVDALAQAVGLHFEQQHKMPVNNWIMVWKKS